jgi:hypothetical protein
MEQSYITAMNLVVHHPMFRSSFASGKDQLYHRKLFFNMGKKHYT